MDISTYVSYIYQRFGKSVFNQVLDDVGSDIKIQKTLTLEELHVYGSSRHGIHKPKQRMIAKNYELETIETGGTFEYEGARDITISKVNYRYSVFDKNK